MPRRILITSALPYANGPLHIGHIAGAYLPADIFTRYWRKKLGADNVLHVCGSDEHGAAITMKALKEGLQPKEIVDRYHAENQQAFADFGIEFNIYHRTSSEVHKVTSQAFFTELHQKGAFVKKQEAQMFDVQAQRFLADRFVMGTCPNCHSPRAYGDQCENCGKTLSPAELIEPHSTLSGSAPELRETWHYYLPMGDHSSWIEPFISEGKLDGKPHHNAETWRKQVVGQCLSWIKGGLGDRAMTRDLDWGVPVPLAEAAGKVLYVWLDAPIGYISATKQWAIDQGEPDAWRPWWTDPSTDLVHFIGKDNIVFHCIIFPIILRAHGGFNLPVNVPANEFLNLEGDKISTSRNHAVWLADYLRDFGGRTDELRYVLCSIAPETKDSEFTWRDYQARVNNELVAILGNFVNRVLVLTHKFYEGNVPSASPSRDCVETCELAAAEVGAHIEAYRFRDGLQVVMNLARYGNKYLADAEPWKRIGAAPADVELIMASALHIAASLAAVMEPFLPATAAGLRSQLNIIDDFVGFSTGHRVGEAKLLFKKIDDSEVTLQLEKLADSKALKTETEPTEPMKPEIAFADFEKLDLRIGTITEATKVEKADKLLVFKVDLGTEVRQIVSGIALHYQPADLVGKQVTVLANLAPRTIRGVVSHGMLLMAEDADGKLRTVAPTAPVSPGSGVS